MKKLKKYLIIFLAPSVVLIFLGSQLENSDCVFEEVKSETFQQFKERSDKAELIQSSHKAMIKAIAKYKKAKRDRKIRQRLTLLAKQNNSNKGKVK